MLNTLNSRPTLKAVGKPTLSDTLKSIKTNRSGPKILACDSLSRRIIAVKQEAVKRNSVRFAQSNFPNFENIKESDRKSDKGSEKKSLDSFGDEKSSLDSFGEEILLKKPDFEKLFIGFFIIGVDNDDVKTAYEDSMHVLTELATKAKV
jgi:hypothetical protein